MLWKPGTGWHFVITVLSLQAFLISDLVTKDLAPQVLSFIHLLVLFLFVSAVLQGLFSQIHGEDDVVREKAIKFLTMKLKSLPEDTLDKDSQDLVVTECKKVRLP